MPAVRTAGLPLPSVVAFVPKASLRVQPASTAYTYDDDNRLISVIAGSVTTPTNTHTFAYDYRSCPV